MKQRMPDIRQSEFLCLAELPFECQSCTELWKRGQAAGSRASMHLTAAAGCQKAEHVWCPKQLSSKGRIFTQSSGSFCRTVCAAFPRVRKMFISYNMNYSFHIFSIRAATVLSHSGLFWQNNRIFGFLLVHGFPWLWNGKLLNLLICMQWHLLNFSLFLSFCAQRMSRW